MKTSAAKGIVLIDPKGRKTTFLRQRKINLTNDFLTVTGHVILTEGIWHGEPDGYGNTAGDCVFSIEHRNPPKGLPLIDESLPIGTLIK